MLLQIRPKYVVNNIQLYPQKCIYLIVSGLLGQLFYASINNLDKIEKHLLSLHKYTIHAKKDANEKVKYLKSRK